MPVVLRRILPLVVLLVAAACESNATGSDTSSVAGTYALVSIDGNPLPYTLPQGVVVQSGTLQLTATGSWSSQIVADAGTDSDGGTFSSSGTAVQFSNGDGESFGGSLAGSDLTLPGVKLGDEQSVDLLFRRQ